MSDTPASPPPPANQPSVTPPPAAAPPAASSPIAVPPAAQRRPGSATTLIWRRPDASTLAGALTTVVIAWLIEMVYQVLYIVEEFSWALNDGPGDIPGAFGDFFFFGILKALFFFGPVFVVLWLLLPIVKESPLPVIIKRAAASGVAGLAGLIVFGIGEAIADTVNFGFAFGYFAVTMIWFPIILAIGFTLQVIVGAVIAWIRASRPRVVSPRDPSAAAAAPPVVPAPRHHAPPATEPASLAAGLPSAPAPPAAAPAPPAAPPAPPAP